jgi:hypothetical protein
VQLSCSCCFLIPCSLALLLLLLINTACVRKEASFPKMELFCLDVVICYSGDGRLLCGVCADFANNIMAREIRHVCSYILVSTSGCDVCGRCLVTRRPANCLTRPPPPVSLVPITRPEEAPLDLSTTQRSQQTTQPQQPRLRVLLQAEQRSVQLVPQPSTSFDLPP